MRSRRCIRRTPCGAAKCKDLASAFRADFPSMVVGRTRMFSIRGAARGGGDPSRKFVYAQADVGLKQHQTANVPWNCPASARVYATWSVTAPPTARRQSGEQRLFLRKVVLWMWAYCTRCWTPHREVRFGHRKPMPDMGPELRTDGGPALRLSTWRKLKAQSSSIGAARRRPARRNRFSHDHPWPYRSYRTQIRAAGA